MFFFHILGVNTNLEEGVSNQIVIINICWFLKLNVCQSADWYFQPWEHTRALWDSHILPRLPALGVYWSPSLLFQHFYNWECIRALCSNVLLWLGAPIRWLTFPAMAACWSEGLRSLPRLGASISWLVLPDSGALGTRLATCWCRRSLGSCFCTDNRV